MAIQEGNEEEEETDTESDEGYNQDTSDDDDDLTESEDDTAYESDDYGYYQGFTFLHNDGVCAIQDKGGIPRNWILLDSQSTIDIFSNASLLMNI